MKVPNLFRLNPRVALGALLLLCGSLLKADPQLTSWFTGNSGKYARIYSSIANETAGTGSTRTVTVSPAFGQSGTSTITIMVNDGTSTTSTTFSFTIPPPNVLLIIADDYGIDAS